MASTKKWLPLESNPEVINKYLVKLGVPGHWGCVDVYSLDKDALKTIPEPSVALMMLFPYKDFENDLCGGRVVSAHDMYFMKQHVGNACGTIALIHAIGNNMDSLKPADGVFKRFFEATKDLNAEERAKALETSGEFENAHVELAQEGQSAAPGVDENVDFHFVTFVNRNGLLYELDGRKSSPVEHGPTSEATFLEDAAAVAKKFMDRDVKQVNFNLLALSKIA